MSRPPFSVGIDLAWGRRARTGVAVLDAEGRLVEVSSVRDDDEIVARVAPYVGAGAVLGVDAPLVVRNEVGLRQAERLVGRYFARYGAGAHAVNRANPAFADGTRAGDLATRLGVPLDPAEGSGHPGPRMIEVYPHPAIVVLMALDRVLPYKAKTGRDVASRTVAFGTLVAGLEGLAHADVPLHVDGPGWDGLVGALATARRHVDLDLVEDQVDAVVCAYVARLDARPGATRALGEVGAGRIVVPVTPDLAARIDAEADLS